MERQDDRQVRDHEDAEFGRLDRIQEDSRCAPDDTHCTLTLGVAGKRALVERGLMEPTPETEDPAAAIAARLLQEKALLRGQIRNLNAERDRLRDALTTLLYEANLAGRVTAGVQKARLALGCGGA